MIRTFHIGAICSIGHNFTGAIMPLPSALSG
jgi:hypothetical protein